MALNCPKESAMTTTRPTMPDPNTIRTPAAQSLELLTRIAAGIEAQNERLATLTDAIAHLIEISDASAQSSADAAEMLAKFGEAWSRPPAAGAATPAAPQGATVVFMAETLSYGIAEDGKPVYKIKGGQFTKFGVRVWPEALQLLGIDAAQLKPGPNAFSAPVIALMGEKGPQKVIGLAK
jgi:hypothetical protein